MNHNIIVCSQDFPHKFYDLYCVESLSLTVLVRKLSLMYKNWFEKPKNIIIKYNNY